MLAAIYPDHEWKMWNFTQVSKNFWENDDNVLAFLAWVQTKLHIRELNDWYYITTEQVAE